MSQRREKATEVLLDILFFLLTTLDAICERLSRSLRRLKVLTVEVWAFVEELIVHAYRGSHWGVNSFMAVVRQLFKWWPEKQTLLSESVSFQHSQRVVIGDLPQHTAEPVLIRVYERRFYRITKRWRKRVEVTRAFTVEPEWGLDMKHGPIDAMTITAARSAHEALDVFLGHVIAGRVD